MKRIGIHVLKYAPMYTAIGVIVYMAFFRETNAVTDLERFQESRRENTIFMTMMVLIVLNALVVHIIERAQGTYKRTSPKTEMIVAAVGIVACVVLYFLYEAKADVSNWFLAIAPMLILFVKGFIRWNQFRKEGVQSN